MAGDAHVDRLEKSIRALGHSETDPLAVDAFKVPHHGSSRNISKELLALVSSSRFLISTNGSYFDHPRAIAMSRIIKYGDKPEVCFNYRSDEADLWDNNRWRTKWGYTTRYPKPAAPGHIAVDL
jgi:hypothetical protein